MNASLSCAHCDISSLDVEMQLKYLVVYCSKSYYRQTINTCHNGSCSHDNEFGPAIFNTLFSLSLIISHRISGSNGDIFGTEGRRKVKPHVEQFISGTAILSHQFLIETHQWFAWPTVHQLHGPVAPPCGQGSIRLAMTNLEQHFFFWHFGHLEKACIELQWDIKNKNGESKNRNHFIIYKSLGVTALWSDKVTQCCLFEGARYKEHNLRMSTWFHSTFFSVTVSTETIEFSVFIAPFVWQWHSPVQNVCMFGNTWNWERSSEAPPLFCMRTHSI